MFLFIHLFIGRSNLLSNIATTISLKYIKFHQRFTKTVQNKFYEQLNQMLQNYRYILYNMYMMYKISFNLNFKTNMAATSGANKIFRIILCLCKRFIPFRLLFNSQTLFKWIPFSSDHFPELVKYISTFIVSVMWLLVMLVQCKCILY